MASSNDRKGIFTYISKRDAELLRTEFFLNYITVASRKVEKDHCVIRLILSSLATPEEIRNLTKKDLRSGKYYSVRLFSKGRSRVSPIDKKTFEMIKRISDGMLSGENIFKFSNEEIDEIIRKNSPPGVEYDAEKLRSDAAKIISDNMFFEESELDYLIRNSKALEKVYLLFEDSNPLYSGAWDVDDDLMLSEFLQAYNLFLGPEDIDVIAEKIGEPVERLRKVLEEF